MIYAAFYRRLMTTAVTENQRRGERGTGSGCRCQATGRIGDGAPALWFDNIRGLPMPAWR